MDSLSTPFKKINEFQLFCDALRSLSHRSPADMSNIISQLSEDRKKKISEIYQLQTINIKEKNGEEQQVTRRIVTVKRRRPAGAGAAGDLQPAPKKQIELPPQ